jgi:hypothetical protein
LFRVVLAVPQVVVLYFLGIAVGVVLVVAWFAVMITGQWPGGMRRFAIGVSRWNARVQAYLQLVTDVYPPFRFQA